MAPSVLVIGSTGNVGSATVNALSAKGVSTRAGVRNTASEKAVALGKLPNVKVVTADLSKPETLPSALAGVTSVFIVTPGAEDRADLAAAGVTAAKTAGVESIVVVSVTTVAEPSDTLFKRQFVAIEDTVKKSGLTYTLLRLPMFIDNQWANQGSIKGEGKIYGPNDASKSMSLVAVQDIGEAAANVLSNTKSHANKTYSLVSDNVSINDITAGFTAAVGRGVEYVQVPYDAAIDAMVGLGFPRWQAGGVAELLKLVDSESAINKIETKELQTLLGRETTSFTTWVNGVAGAFKAQFTRLPQHASSKRKHL